MLVVSRDGVAFLPDEGREREDAFSFSHSEFLHGLDDGTLTITSRDRTYRFKAALAADKDDNEPATAREQHRSASLGFRDPRLLLAVKAAGSSRVQRLTPRQRQAPKAESSLPTRGSVAD
jgi:hypothetical protein